MQRRMILLRSFEQRAEQMYQQRKIAGFLHLYMGQEAVGVGLTSALRKDDYIATSYRDHGIALALGVTPGACMAELFGRETGVSRGRGGSMHYYSKEHNLLGGHGIVGGQIAVSLGAGFAAHYKNTDQVSIALLGDGAVHQGVFHESANLASLWSLPVIFVIEDNQYSMGTSVQRSSAVQDFTLKGPGYAMDTAVVDGMNLLDCYATFHEAITERRKNPRPILIHVRTYRYRGHSISDPARYRSREEVAHYQKIDPIQQMRGLLKELGWLDDESADKMGREVRREILDAIDFADASPEPALASLSDFVLQEE